MRLDAAFSEFSIEVMGHSRCKVKQITFLSCFFLHFFEFFKLLLLNDICELLTNELELLLVKDIDMFIQILVEPFMLQHLIGGNSLFWDLLEHFLHQINSLLGDNIFFVFYFLVKLLHGIQIADLISFERDIAV